MSALEVKEGVVLDRDGTTLYQPDSVREKQRYEQGFGRVHVIRGGWPLAIALSILLPILLFAGFAVFGVVAAVFFVVMLVRWLVRSISRALH